MLSEYSRQLVKVRLLGLKNYEDSFVKTFSSGLESPCVLRNLTIFVAFTQTFTNSSNVAAALSLYNIGYSNACLRIGPSFLSLSHINFRDTENPDLNALGVSELADSGDGS